MASRGVFRRAEAAWDQLGARDEPEDDCGERCDRPRDGSEREDDGGEAHAAREEATQGADPCFRVVGAQEGPAVLRGRGGR